MMNMDFMRMTPDFILQDQEGYAMARAIETAMIYFLQKLQEGVDCIVDVDKMPEWRLEEMAWEYNVSWYDHDAPIEEKRAQIKDANAYYGRQGTPAAVEGAISAVFGDGILEEWFEYGGEPYHFRVYTTNSTAMLENRKRFDALVDRAKNLRSVLESVTYYGARGVARAYAGTKVTGVEGMARGRAI